MGSLMEEGVTRGAGRVGDGGRCSQQRVPEAGGRRRGVGPMAKKGVVEGAAKKNGSHQAGGSWGPLQWALSHLTSTSRG